MKGDFYSLLLSHSHISGRNGNIIHFYSYTSQCYSSFSDKVVLKGIEKIVISDLNGLLDDLVFTLKEI